MNFLVLPALTLYQYVVLFRSAIEILEVELKETTSDVNISVIDNGFSDQTTAAAGEILKLQEKNVVSAHFSLWF